MPKQNPLLNIVKKQKEGKAVAIYSCCSSNGEVSELLRVSRRTLQEYRNNRVLPFILLGGKVLYPETGLRGVLEANYRKPLE